MNGLKTCQFCAEEIKEAAIVCRYCGNEVPQQTENSSPSEVKLKNKKSKNLYIWIIFISILSTVSILCSTFSRTLFINNVKDRENTIIKQENIGRFTFESGKACRMSTGGEVCVTLENSKDGSMINSIVYIIGIISLALCLSLTWKYWKTKEYKVSLILSLIVFLPIICHWLYSIFSLLMLD